jgi:peptidoglycan LD-endopeptidase LytH
LVVAADQREIEQSLCHRDPSAVVGTREIKCEIFRGFHCEKERRCGYQIWTDPVRKGRMSTPLTAVFGTTISRYYFFGRHRRKCRSRKRRDENRSSIATPTADGTSLASRNRVSRTLCARAAILFLALIFGPFWNHIVSAEAESTPHIGTPIARLRVADLHDSFDELRHGHRHEAIDLMEPRGTPIYAVDNGTIRKLFLSAAGGKTIYEFDSDGRYCYYYAHLDRYADDLREGSPVHRGQVIGYVGTSGDASPDAPQLHFAILRLNSGKLWWKGTPINPYPILLDALMKASSAR